jgi:hypothetical protein
MGKWLLAVSLFVFAVWWLRREAWRATRPRSPVPVAASQPSAPPPPLAPVMARPPVAAARPANAPAPAPEKLDIKSDELRNRLDEQIPRRLYAEAARCYRGGLQPDQRLDLSYRLRVNDGEISVGDLRILEDTLDDPALERCIQSRIVAARWRDDALPDLDEQDDLYMRVGGFQSQLASAERAASAP